jgi:flagellar biosynthesis/type III secretory pathway protein FliH
VLKKTLSILALASIVTGGALRSGESKALADDEPLQARPAATAEAQQGSTWHRGGYADGYRDGYRQGFRAGYQDGLSGVYREPNLDSSPGSAYELGFSRGYRQGYRDGFHRGSAEARPGRPW